MTKKNINIYALIHYSSNFIKYFHNNVVKGILIIAHELSLAEKKLNIIEELNIIKMFFCKCHHVKDI